MLLSNKGFGINDTLYISNNSSTIQPGADEISFSQAIKNECNSNLSLAINNLKNIINNYPNSKYLNVSVINLYKLYNKLDTINNQTYRNGLYGELKLFLESKMQTYQGNSKFVKNAYDIALMCATNKREFSESLSGYEYIALNDPDPSVRMLAASDYLVVSSLTNGSGGAANNKLQANKKFVDLKPINKIVARAFEMDKLKSKDDINNDKIRFNRKETLELKGNSKVQELLNAKSLTNSEKIKRVEEGALSIIDRSYFDDETDKNNTTMREEYSILQNYPNPFNPTTNIQYNLPTDNIVSIKVYDLLGKEIMTLVNEFKNAGSYTVSFNGSNLSSGVYYYKIKSGSFEQIMRMVLLK